MMVNVKTVSLNQNQFMHTLVKKYGHCDWRKRGGSKLVALFASILGSSIAEVGPISLDEV